MPMDSVPFVSLVAVAFVFYGLVLAWGSWYYHQK